MTEVIEGEAVEVDEEGAPLPVVMPPSPSTALVAQDEITVAQLIAQSSMIEAAMREAMTEGVHYGRIPGVNKPTLLKPGAEKLLVLFRLAPAYESEKIWHDNGHLTVIVKCILNHIPTGLKIAEGEGMCTTRESRYAYRKAERLCPACGEPQVREGKPRDGRPGNWYCWKKQGGCGATWDLDSEQGQAFKAMETGRVDNPDLPDTFNTVLKMADKRALNAAILNGTAASDIFTQDMEDARSNGGGGVSGSESSEPRQQQTKQKAEVVFHPATVLLPLAPDKAKGWKGIADVFKGLDSELDWGVMIFNAIASLNDGEGDFRKLAKQPASEAAYRLSNVAARLTEVSKGEGAFLSWDQIQGAFAEMFEGFMIEIPDAEAITTMDEAAAEAAAADD